MTQWKIPSRHLQSWLLGSSRSGTKSTHSMVYRKFWLFNIQKQHKDIVKYLLCSCFFFAYTWNLFTKQNFTLGFISPLKLTKEFYNNLFHHLISDWFSADKTSFRYWIKQFRIKSRNGFKFAWDIPTVKHEFEVKWC